MLARHYIAAAKLYGLRWVLTAVTEIAFRLPYSPCLSLLVDRLTVKIEGADHE